MPMARVFSYMVNLKVIKYTGQEEEVLQRV
jgi:hypothetical protein